MPEENPKDELARLNKLYVAVGSEDWKQIWEPMLLDHKAIAKEDRCSMDTEKEDPNLTVIKFIDNFFINIKNALERMKELESELKDSDKEES